MLLSLFIPLLIIVGEKASFFFLLLVLLLLIDDKLSKALICFKILSSSFTSSFSLSFEKGLLFIMLFS